MAVAADWNLPLTVSSGAARTGVVLGLHTNATDGFDAGLDSPTPFTDETLNAYFSHPEWNISAAGSPVTTFHRDVRGTVPQTFSFQVKTTLSPVTMVWDSALIPAEILAVMRVNGTSVSMNKAGSHSFATTGSLTTVDIDIHPGDSTPPASPANLSFSIKGSAIYLSWDANREDDLGGYKLHLLDGAGTATRSVDLKKATNYNMMNVLNDTPYNLAISAYDVAGNESARSTAVTAIKVAGQQTGAGADGDFDGDGVITISDAIKVLRMSLGMDKVTTTAMAHCDMDGDGRLTVRDAVKLLRITLGLSI